MQHTPPHLNYLLAHLTREELAISLFISHLWATVVQRSTQLMNRRAGRRSIYVPIRSRPGDCAKCVVQGQARCICYITWTHRQPDYNGFIQGRPEQKPVAIGDRRMCNWTPENRSAELLSNGVAGEIASETIVKLATTNTND